MNQVELLYGLDVFDGLKQLDDGSVDCVVTSPPYFGLRKYGVNGELGLEPTVEEYVGRMANVFREVWRVVKKSGTVWLNLGDSYSGSGLGWSKKPNGLKMTQRFWRETNELHKRPTAYINAKQKNGIKPKNLYGMPWRVAFALQADGWWLRSDIIWSKPNPMPESVRDRPTRAHEYIFLFTKADKYFYNSDAIKTPIKESSKVRLAQDIENQKGSFRIAGKTNGPMKAIYSRASSNWHQGKLYFEDHGKGEYGLEGFGFRGHSGNKLGNGKKLHVANKRSVWIIPTRGFKGAHFATFPPEIPRLCILAGCPPKGVVLDPFAGTATVGEVALKLGRKFIGIDLNKKYEMLAKERLGLLAFL